MQRKFLLSIGVIATLGVNAQNAHRTGQVAERVDELRQAGVRFTSTQLFTPQERTAATDAQWSAALTDARVVRLDRTATARLMQARSEHISLELPSDEGVMVVDLERVDLFTPDFQLTIASTDGPVEMPEGLHYRGAIRGVPGSLAAVSVFPDEVMGLFSDDGGERVLGRFADDTEGDHVLYHEADLRGSPNATCGTADVDMGDTGSTHSPTGADRTVKCVRYYWEVNYDIFQGKGSVANATNYVTGLFNQTAVLYANDGISVTLSQVYVWDVPSPYTSSSTGTQLDTFGATRTSFNGDLAHLLGYTGGGGVAYVNTICSSQTRYRMAYSDINSTYQNVPTYSWSVEVVTHEQGHNMGSPHTHACSWNGNNTAIDGCGPAAGYSEGSCAAGPMPASGAGGTIMSYCHLVSGVGINFNNGFGPQPAALIVSRINNASCLVNCSTTSCNAPTGLAATSITGTSATLSWTPASGASSHTLQWKATAASTWTTVGSITGSSHNLTGLSAGTAYQFQVRTECGTTSSAYAAPVSFTTATATCGVPSGSTAGSITTSSALLSWGAVSGATNYTLQWKLTSGTTWTTVNNITGTSYSLTGLSASTSYQFQVRTTCAAGSSAYGSAVTFSTAAATCSDVHEPNNSLNNARSLASNVTTTGLIASRYDQDWFRFANTSSARNMRVRLTGLPANYSLTIYRGSTIVGSSNVSGTGNEQVILNSATVATNYGIRVAGVSGAYSASACYTLIIETAGTAFNVEGLPEEGVHVEEPAGLITGLYPNPAREQVTVQWTMTDENTRVELIDGLGRVVDPTAHQDPSGSAGAVISLSERPAGLYFIRVSRGDAVEVRRLVVSH